MAKPTGNRPETVGAAHGERGTKTFAELLRWHLDMGTRPPGPTAGRGPWTVQEFADECGVDERTIRNWLNGKRVLGTNLATIERLLFGPDQVAAAEARRALRDAFARLRSGDRES